MCNKVVTKKNSSIIIFFQKRHRVELDDKFEEDLSFHLKGSPIKFAKCLDLLQLIVTSNRLLIQIESSSIQTLTLRLYDLCFRHPDFRQQSLICLVEILKRNHMIALPFSTMLFIEMNCKLEVKSSWPQFVAFLINWLKIVLKLNVKRPVLQFEVLLNYVSRIPCLPEAKVS